MFLGLLTLITALSISAVAIYYSVAGLVAIFAAAAVPIMIMGATLEIAKLVTAVWLHYYWDKTVWWLRTYLGISVIVLMFITSMGIFGFLSKAHIEQTAAAEEGLAQIERIQEEIVRQTAVIERAEKRIAEAEDSIGQGNLAIQEQIDREQERINTAYVRIQPAIDEQNAIIESAREADKNRTAPFEQQLAALDEELQRLDVQALQYEERISKLSIDTSAVDPVLAQITNIEDTIVRVEGQLASRERDQIKAAQRTIGANDDGSAGPATRRAADAWIEQQRARIIQLQTQVSELRAQAQSTIDSERTRLTNLVATIRGSQTEAIKSRQLEILATIDSVRSTESPIIQTARDEIARIRTSADAQIAQSNILIQNLRNSLTIGKDAQVESIIEEQQAKIIEANNIIDTVTQEKFSLEAEYRKLEAEVGPIKYIAEFVYGDRADKDLLEEAVRWVIITIIFVFDPLAVLLLIASQYTFGLVREKRQIKKRNTDEKHYRFDDSLANGQSENRNETSDRDRTTVPEARTYFDTNREVEGNDSLLRTGSQRRDLGTTQTTLGVATDDIKSDTLATDDDSRIIVSKNNDANSNQMDAGLEQNEIQLDETEQARRQQVLDESELSEDIKASKQKWKEENPNQNIKFWKDQYIKGKIDELPWVGYVQNSEQSDNSLWNRLRSKDE